MYTLTRCFVHLDPQGKWAAGNLRRLAGQVRRDGDDVPHPIKCKLFLFWYLQTRYTDVGDAIAQHSANSHRWGRSILLSS
jgi:hypothetical protein